MAENDKSLFNEHDIVLRFPALSDIHISGNIQSAKLAEALDQLNETGPLDALLIGGDFTDFGLPEQIRTFCRVLTDKVNLDKTRLVLAMGNHELYNHEINKVPFAVNTLLQEALGNDYQHGASGKDTARCRYHTQINGIDLVAVSCLSFENGGARFDQEDVDWLDEILTQADPDKPVFITTHAMLEGTEWGSDMGRYWAEEYKGKLRTMLDRHPNAIVFSGHLHFPLNHEKSIWQGEFTGVGTASVYFASMDGHNPNGVPFLFMRGNEPSDFMEFSQGILVEVDDAGNSRLTRMDFHNKKTIGEPWILPAPKADNSHLKPYSVEERAKAKHAPCFAPDAKVQIHVVHEPMELLEVSFPKAIDDDVVLSYELTFADKQTGKAIKTVALYSDYYRSTCGKDGTVTVRMDDRMLYPFSVHYPDDYTCQVTAYDCFDTASQPLFSETVKGSGIREAVQSGREIHRDWQFKNYCSFNHYPTGYVLQPHTDYNSWPTPETKNAAKHLRFGAEGWQNSHGLVTEITSDDSYLGVLYTNPAKGYAADFAGAKECWIWVDCADVAFDTFFFGFRTNNAYGDQYTTQEHGGCPVKAWFLPDGKTEWNEVLFNQDGAGNLSGFKGFIRFAVSDFSYIYSLFPTDLQAFIFSFKPAPNQVGKRFVIDQIGFAGPQIDGADGTVAQLLQGEQFDE